jgi:hypothetical protein
MHHSSSHGPRELSQLSPVQLGRLDYQPQTTPALANANSIDFGDLEVSQSQIEGGADIIQRCFPNTYGEPLVEITERAARVSYGPPAFSYCRSS